MLIGNEAALAGLSYAEKLRMRDRMAQLLTNHGHNAHTSAAAADTPGDLVCSLDARQVQRPHLEAIDRELKWVHDTPNAALMIWTPPQVGKSWRVSRAFPFWWLTHRPRDRILLASVTATLARSHSLAARTLVDTHGRQFGLAKDPKEWTGTDWSLASGGGLRVRGIGGALIGHPGNLGLIDDPYAGRQAADSPTVRAAVWDWYSSVFLSRLAPGAPQVITMTRWHPDDLCGRLLERDGRIEDGGRWRVLHLPAIAMAPDLERGFYADPLGREPGEPLTHPAIESNDTAALLLHWGIKRAESTIRDWDAMYQGSPYRSEGATLTEQDIRDRTGVPPEEFRRTGVAVDPSGGGRDTAGLIAGGLDDKGRLWWTHDETAVMAAGEWADAACRLAARVDADLFVIEANYGGDQASTLIGRAWKSLLAAGELLGADGTPIPENAPCPRLKEVHSRKSKILRAEPIAQAVKLGAIWFARGDHLHQLRTEWTLWEPNSTWSPGALDAAVHMAYEMLPPPNHAASVVSVANRNRSQVKEGGVTARRIHR